MRELNYLDIVIGLYLVYARAECITSAIDSLAVCKGIIWFMIRVDLFLAQNIRAWRYARRGLVHLSHMREVNILLDDY